MKTITITPKKLSLGALGKKLDKMTEDEVYAAGIGHIVGMTEQSVVTSGTNDTCQYKSINNCCGAAPFIQDYQFRMEGKTWKALTNNDDEGHEYGQSRNHWEAIDSLQKLHDNGSIFNKETTEEKIKHVNTIFGHYRNIEFVLDSQNTTVV